eukprot:6491776-Amphidinium_carterae.4
MLYAAIIRLCCGAKRLPVVARGLHACYACAHQLSNPVSGRLPPFARSHRCCARTLDTSQPSSQHTAPLQLTKVPQTQLVPSASWQPRLLLSCLFALACCSQLWFLAQLVLCRLQSRPCTTYTTVLSTLPCSDRAPRHRLSYPSRRLPSLALILVLTLACCPAVGAPPAPHARSP